jgi:Invasion protein B, involved in pathogenesis
MSHFYSKAVLACALLTVSSAAFAQSATSATYDNWTVRCSTREEEGKKLKGCQVDSTAFVKLQSGQTAPIMGLTLQRPDPTKPMRFHANVQLMSSIKEGVRIQGADGKDILVLNYEMCRQDLCETWAEVKDNQIQALKKLENMVVIYKGWTQQNGMQDVRMEVSLKGFNEAYDAMMKEISGK